MKTSQLLTTISLVTSAVSASYTYKGCYKLSSLSTTLQSKGEYMYQTNSYCQGVCSGYAVAATYNSGYCYCGNSLPDDLETGECTATCFGYSTDICGSSDSLSVYVDLSLLEESADKSSSTSTSTTSTSTSTSASTSSTTTSTSSTTSSTSSTTSTVSSTPTTTTTTSATTSATTEEATSTTSQPASQSAAQSTTTLAPSQTTIIYNIIQSYEGQTLMVTSTVEQSSASASATATGSSTSDNKKGNNNNKSTNSGLSNGAKIGIIVGCIVGFLIIAAVIIVVVFFYKRQSEDEDEDEKSAGKHIASRQASVRQGKQSNGSGSGGDSDDDFDDSFSTTNVSDNSHMMPYSTIPGLPAKPQVQPHAYKSFAGAGDLGSNNVNDNSNDAQIYSPPTAMSNANNDYDYRKRFSDLSLPDERKLRVVNPDLHEDTLENPDESGYFDSYYENNNDNDDNSTLNGH